MCEKFSNEIYIFCFCLNFDCSPWHREESGEHYEAKVKENKGRKCMCTIEFNSQKSSFETLDTNLKSKWNGAHRNNAPTTIALRINFANGIIFISNLVT